MKNKKDALKEMIEFIKIEKKLGKETITKEEVELVKKLADEKRYPRAEYVLAIMYLKGYGVSEDKEMGMKYLDRSSERASYNIQLKIAHIYHSLGEIQKTKKCLRLAIKDCKINI